MDKVKVCVISPDRFVHTKTVRPDANGMVRVKIHDTWRAYLVPHDLYAAGQRDFVYCLEDAQPLDLAALQVTTNVLNTFAQTYPSTLVWVNRRARLEMLQALPGAVTTQASKVAVKIPEIGFMFSGTLAELAQAIEDVENNRLD